MRTRKYPIYNDDSIDGVYVLNVEKDGYPLAERIAFEQYATEQVRGTKLEYRQGKIAWICVPEPMMYKMGVERELKIEVNNDWMETT